MVMVNFAKRSTVQCDSTENYPVHKGCHPYDFSKLLPQLGLHKVWCHTVLLATNVQNNALSRSASKGKAPVAIQGLLNPF